MLQQSRPEQTKGWTQLGSRSSPSRASVVYAQVAEWVGTALIMWGLEAKAKVSMHLVRLQRGSYHHYNRHRHQPYPKQSEPPQWQAGRHCLRIKAAGRPCRTVCDEHMLQHPCLPARKETCREEHLVLTTASAAVAAATSVAAATAAATVAATATAAAAVAAATSVAAAATSVAAAAAAAKVIAAGSTLRIIACSLFHRLAL